MTFSPIAASLADDPNFGILASDDDYTRYFNQLGLVFQSLMRTYERPNQTAPWEANAVSGFLSKLLRTVQVLRLKYAHQGSERRSLWIDLTESGFPNRMEIDALRVDMARRDEQLRELPAASILKRHTLDYLFQYRKDPGELLRLLSLRRYLEELAPEKLFMPYAPGEIAFLGTEGDFRSYSYSWGCFDFSSNRPYLHVMTCEQDEDAPPLDQVNSSQQAFLEVMQAEGGRVPNVGILAVLIDQALEWLHPKILKRIRIGPLYSRMLLEGRPVNVEDPREEAIRSVLLTDRSRADDFILFFSDEIVFSKRQEITRSLLSPKSRIREIFMIEETDPECFEARASVIHHYALLPHSLLQHLSRAEQEQIPGFSKARVLTIDEKGVVHGF